MMDVESLACEYLTEKDPDLKMDTAHNVYRCLDKFIGKICSKYTAFEEMDDLRQECFFAVINALDSWEPEKSKFITHVGNYIPWYLFRTLKRSGEEHQLVEYRKYERFREKYFSEHGEAPSDEVIAKYFQVPPERVVRICKNAKLMKKVVSLDDTIPGTDGMTYGETIPDERQNIEDSSLDEYTRSQIRSRVDSLPGDEKAVIIKRFYNECREGLTPKERNLQNKAFRKLERDKILRSIAYEEAIICRAYSWRNRDISSTEWSALELYENSRKCI